MLQCFFFIFVSNPFNNLMKMAFEPSVGHLSWHHGLANAHFAVMIFQAIALIKKQHNYCKPWIRSADVWWLLQFTVSFQWWYYLLWTNNVHGRSLIILASFDCIDKPTTLNRDIVLWGNGSKYDKPTWCIFLQSTEHRVEVNAKVHMVPLIQDWTSGVHLEGGSFHE